MIARAKMPNGWRRRMTVALAAVWVLAVGAIAPVTLAVPMPNQALRVRDIPDWLSLEAAARLDIGFTVLAPPEIPLPFGGEPEISAYAGYYSLYWLVPGTPPTFLQITGEVGGSIPDYSKYDRNVQLEQNAAVSGSPAYHDLTPIYDLVYWQVGDIVYSVESNNLVSEDSLGIANALVPLTQPEESPGDEANDAAIAAPPSVASGGSATITVESAGSATLAVDQGTFVEGGGQQIAVASGDTVEWQAPESADDLTASFTLVDSQSGDTLATTSTLVVAAAVHQAETNTLAITCPSNVMSGAPMTFTISGAGRAIVDATAGVFPDESPNSEFATDGSDDNTLVGDLPESGTIDLVWNAPVVDSATMVYLFVSTEDGETPGECDILVAPESGEATATTEQGVSESVDATNTPENPAAPAATEAAVEPTRAPKPTRTPKGYDEVIGLPTALPMDDGTGGGDARTVPTPTPIRTPTPRPTATFAPTSGDNGMMAQSIGPGGGSLTSPLGITVTIPKGALTETVTLSIQPVGLTKLPPSSSVSLIDASGFDVAIASSNGVAITEPLKKPAEIRITVAKTTDASARLYRVDGVRLIPLMNTRREQDELVVSVTTFDQYVAGVPVATTASTRRNVLPFVLAAAVVLFAMIAMVVLGGIFRPRRQRVISTRRPPRRTFR